MSSAGAAVLGWLLLAPAALAADAWDATARALIAGIAVHLVAWGVAVAVWRQIMLAELQALHEERLERARRRAELVSTEA